jgi:drug/metabolite transporter (DMT)-like permease
MADDGPPKPAAGPAAPASGVAPYLALTVGAAFWGGTWPVARSLIEAVPPATLAFSRWAIALVVLLPVTLAPLIRHRADLRREFWRIAFVSACGVAGFNAMIFKGLHTTTAINGALINAATPIYIVLLSLVGIGEKSRWKQIAGVAVSLPGLVLIITRGAPERILTLQFVDGDLWVAGAMFLWALYNIFVRQWPSKLPPLAFISATAVISLVLLAPFVVLEAAEGMATRLTEGAIGGAIYLGVFASVGSYLVWNFGVRRIGAGPASLFQYLIPVFAAIFAVLLIDETVQAYHVIGAALIVAGIWVANARRLPWRRARTA